MVVVGVRPHHRRHLRAPLLDRRHERRQPGGEIIAWGGANFAQSLSRVGLVDEYVLVIQPVAFGTGLPLFAGLPDALRLDLTEAKTFDSTVLHIYKPSDRATRPPA